MKLSPGFTLAAALALVSALDFATGQQMPGSLSFVIISTAESSSSVLITDNDLTNGYKSGFDMIAPQPHSIRPARWETRRWFPSPPAPCLVIWAYTSCCAAAAAEINRALGNFEGLEFSRKNLLPTRGLADTPPPAREGNPVTGR